MIPFKLHSSRFELKYLVDEARACQVRDYVRSHLVPDPHCDPDSSAYVVSSLYLDSDGLDLCNATVQGHKNRFKLRVRWYRHDEESPYFVEIKRRVNDQIIKHRAPVHQGAVHELLSGHQPTHSHLFGTCQPGSIGVLEDFCRLRNSMHASGTVYVRYDREAWVPGEHDFARVTFDRNLHGSPYSGSFDLPSEHKWQKPRLGSTILELKFTDTIPAWMRQLIQVFNLERCSVPKYVTCATGIDRFQGQFVATSMKENA